jgi:hypothetical protein
MAKARQNLNRRIYSSTVFDPLTEENKLKRQRLMARRAGGDPNIGTATFHSIPEDGNVEHVHDENCHHTFPVASPAL